jgi:RNA polymerase sigma-32 factor
MIKIGGSAAQKKLFFELRRTKTESRRWRTAIFVPKHASLIAQKLGVQQKEVVEMNRRLAGDVSLNT